MVRIDWVFFGHWSRFEHKRIRRVGTFCRDASRCFGRAANANTADARLRLSDDGTQSCL